MRARLLSRLLSPLPASALLCVSAVALASCGTTPTAEAPSRTPVTSSPSSVVTAPTGPTVTVPGLGDTRAATTSSDQVSSSSPASSSVPETTTTVVVPPTSKPGKPGKTTSESADSSSAATTTPTTSSDETTAEPTTSEPETTAEEPPPPTTSHRSATSKEATGQQPPAGGTMTHKVVVIDPGHNGQNNAHPEIITQQVDAGFGEQKNCNTTGTATNAGYTETLFNWKVALHLKAELEAKGITVVMTRDSNDGVGPCVNERAAIGNDNVAAAVISIHGDGDDAAANGFYVMTAERHPSTEEMAAQSARLASDVRDGLVAGGLTPSTHLGSDGLWERADLAGLNLSVRPTVMVELGNMRNDEDAALMSSEQGQAQYAKGLALGVVQYLIGR